jgi:hypothetical protein
VIFFLVKICYLPARFAGRGIKTVKCQFCEMGLLITKMYQICFEKYHDETAYKLCLHNRNVLLRKKKIMCDQCPFIFSCKSSLDYHKFRCHKEHYSNESNQSLEQEHLEIKTGTGELQRNIGCQLCTLGGLMSTRSYQQHYDKFHDETVYECEICKKNQ